MIDIARMFPPTASARLVYTGTLSACDSGSTP